MKTKICTSLEQSKKLVELGMDIETADMCYFPVQSIENNVHYNLFAHKEKVGIPAWSLSKLLVIIRDWQCVWLGANDMESWVTEFNLGSGKHYTTAPTTDPLDAVYNCLVWLIKKRKVII